MVGVLDLEAKRFYIDAYATVEYNHVCPHA
jgi:hypothetical protein